MSVASIVEEPTWQWSTPPLMLLVCTPHQLVNPSKYSRAVINLLENVAKSRQPCLRRWQENTLTCHWILQTWIPSDLHAQRIHHRNHPAWLKHDLLQASELCNFAIQPESTCVAYASLYPQKSSCKSWNTRRQSYETWNLLTHSIRLVQPYRDCITCLRELPRPDTKLKEIRGRCWPNAAAVSEIVASKQQKHGFTLD